MNLLKLSWKNLLHKPLTLALNLLLFALGVGLISFLLLVNTQLEEKFEKNLAGIDLVVGAKGSPLQLILSSMFHIDAPTGNIPLEAARPFLNPKHPLIKEAYPLSLGDSYKGYRIVGTEKDFLNLYNATINKGQIWEAPFEVVLGANVANALQLGLDSTFHSAHGLSAEAAIAHEHRDFRVTGILKKTGTVVDQLILTPTQSVWQVHDHAAAIADTDKEITALLLKFKGNNYRSLNLGRNINENTEMMAASPAWEMNRLYANIGAGEEVLRLLAYLIIFVSGLSIFISLYNALKERKYEMALMRVMGASATKLFVLILLEGMLIALLGYGLGIGLSHTGLYFLGESWRATYRYEFSAFVFLEAEIWLFAGALLIGILAALLPAWQARRTAISNTLRTE